MDPTLDRFVTAQSTTYDTALRELRAGAKRTHWMWFVFPQIKGLGQSQMAWHYGIADLAEAQAYLQHPLLGERLIECTRAVLGHQGRAVSHIFPPPDDLKFASCMTLFSLVPGAPPEFGQAIKQCLGGVRDANTLKLAQ